MPDTVIKVENIYKRYTLSSLKGESFKDWSARLLMSAIGQRSRRAKNDPDFWALKNISFELKQGDSLGIFGKNGAGKSTLLKILSEVSAPTSGTVEINGKVASVLELGMGFHPDLSGRDNIFLTGNLLGMNQKFIKSNIDEIIAFSEIGKFIDVPVKHYSGGMYVRLAFSMVTHIEADILILDEVLSVGDAEFRLKTLQKIRDLSVRGKTIIIVTHNLSEITNICNTAMVMENGAIKAWGSPANLVSEYVQEAHERALNCPPQADLRQEEKILLNEVKIWEDMAHAPGNETARISRIEVRGKGKPLHEKIYMNDAITVEIWFIKCIKKDRTDVGFTLYDSSGNNVFASTSALSGHPSTVGCEGSYKAHCEIPGNYFNSGSFSMNVFIVDNEKEVYRSFTDVVFFKVHLNESEKDKPWINRFPGPLRPMLNWGLMKM